VWGGWGMGGGEVWGGGGLEGWRIGGVEDWRGTRCCCVGACGLSSTSGRASGSSKGRARTPLRAGLCACSHRRGVHGVAAFRLASRLLPPRPSRGGPGIGGRWNEPLSINRPCRSAAIRPLQHAKGRTRGSGLKPALQQGSWPRSVTSRLSSTLSLRNPPARASRGEGKQGRFARDEGAACRASSPDDQ